MAWVRPQEVTIDTFCGCPAQQLTVVCGVTSFFSYVSGRTRTKLPSTANLKRMLFASGVKGSNVKDATILFNVLCTWTSVSDEHPPRTKSTSWSSDWTSTACSCGHLRMFMSSFVIGH